MATATSLTNMVAFNESAGVPAIGHVVWFSVPDRPVSLNHLKLRWLIAGLDPSSLPKDPRELYLFKRACAAQDGKVRLKDGSVIDTDVRPNQEDANLCSYQITRVVRDAELERVVYKAALAVTYVKASGDVTYSPMDGATDEEVRPIREGIERYLSDNAKAIDGRKVRAIVRKYLKETSDPNDKDAMGNVRVTGLCGENLRGKGGGVYFVKAEWRKELSALAEALEGLYPDKAAYLYKVPLADADSVELREHFRRNAVKEIEDAIADVAALLREDRKNSVRSDVRAFWFKKLLLLQTRLADYEGLLKEDQTDVRAKLDVMKAQIERLL